MPHIAVGPLAEESIASAATCNIGGTTKVRVEITGTAPITSFGAGVNKIRWGRFSGALTLTHNATSLILPGGANITTAAGDTFFAASDGSGNWRVQNYTKANGKTVIAPSSGDITTSTTNDSAASGGLGELVSSAREVGSAAAATPNTAINAASGISLTAGDWDVHGVVGFTGNAATNVAYVMGGINATTDTLPTNSTDLTALTFAATTLFSVGDGNLSLVVPRRRISLSGTTTIYIVAKIGFTTNTAAVFGKIEARRVR